MLDAELSPPHATPREPEPGPERWRERPREPEPGSERWRERPREHRRGRSRSRERGDGGRAGGRGGPPGAERESFGRGGGSRYPPFGKGAGAPGAGAGAPGKGVGAPGKGAGAPGKGAGAPATPINRRVVSPSMVPVVFADTQHRSAVELASRWQDEPDLRLHLWPDTTLRELNELLRATHDPASKAASISVGLVYPGRRGGAPELRVLGPVHRFHKAQTDEATLALAFFEPGDWLEAALMSESAATAASPGAEAEERGAAQAAEE